MSERIDARRNDTHQPGEEVLVLRHYKLRKGYHQAFKQASERGVWLVFEKIGTRIVGDFRVVHPDDRGSPEYDENYRLARYASYQHWVETRRPLDMMGSGPLLELSRIGGSRRMQYVLDSDGAYFMTGRMIEDMPYHLPGVTEDYELADAGSADKRPVRYDVPVPGEAIAELICWRVAKGAFAEFDSLTREGMLPAITKMGARGVGIWKLIYPEPAIGEEHEDYDEIMMITRYASYEHWQACNDPVRLIGNGPDCRALMDASSRRDSLIRDQWRRFLQGELYHSPPTYAPPLDEDYRQV
ncbi:MAG: hypothetical protein OXK78_13310 [Caldilineaceae bacterium]|nr:hypothetical protein [Caldilineaceae bacterium]